MRVLYCGILAPKLLALQQSPTKKHHSFLLALHSPARAVACACMHPFGHLGGFSDHALQCIHWDTSLSCLPPLASGTGGESFCTNAVNTFYGLRCRLPAFLMYELERPIVRDLIGKGLGES
jgi:hypothetical protein